MPGFNRRGPQDEGSLTGRRRGLCSKNNINKTENVSDDNNTKITCAGIGFENKTRNRQMRMRGNRKK